MFPSANAEPGATISSPLKGDHDLVFQASVRAFVICLNHPADSRLISSCVRIFVAPGLAAF